MIDFVIFTNTDKCGNLISLKSPNWVTKCTFFNMYICVMIGFRTKNDQSINENDRLLIYQEQEKDIT